ANLAQRRTRTARRGPDAAAGRGGVEEDRAGGRHRGRAGRVLCAGRAALPGLRDAQGAPRRAAGLQEPAFRGDAGGGAGGVRRRHGALGSGRGADVAGDGVPVRTLGGGGDRGGGGHPGRHRRLPVRALPVRGRGAAADGPAAEPAGARLRGGRLQLPPLRAAGPRLPLLADEPGAGLHPGQHAHLHDGHGHRDPPGLVRLREPGRVAPAHPLGPRPAQHHRAAFVHAARRAGAAAGSGEEGAAEEEKCL
ncbi:MAG: hypothetical protein AVDCRST_MAG68-1552, partial [uncultured Gemmatimonadetes bacterium]